MSSVASEWRSLRSKFPERRAQLGLSLRVTIAALSGFAVSHLLKVPLPLWTVVTAVVLTQATFGRSVKATIDYLAGTLGGAVYAGAVAILVPHSNDVSLAGVLALEHAGALAFSRTGDPATGEFQDAYEVAPRPFGWQRPPPCRRQGGLRSSIGHSPAQFKSCRRN
jgi:uncharacterized membrane protein YccC